MQGLVFDIKEMAVYDGPGIRTTVFLKGCSLHCAWCHNPEGMAPYPQLMVSTVSCLDCGACAATCLTGADPLYCTACGACIPVCPLHLRRIAGETWEASALAAELLRNRTILENNNGGITFSGGEPLMQHEFVLAVVGHLQGLHCAIETSGFALPGVFSSVVDAMDYVIMDIKMVDSRLHQSYCGVPNGMILQNLEYLKHANVPFMIRIPVIPGVNDDAENLIATAELLQGVRNLEKVELLPYQKTAGAKYPMLSRAYEPRFDVDAIPNMDAGIFIARGVPCTIA